MSRKGRGLTVLMAAAVLAALAWVAWLVWRPADHLFRGQLESAWISSLNNLPRNEEMARWRSFGPEAVPVLIKALRQGTGPMERMYFKLWPKLPAGLKQRLSAPVDYWHARNNAALLLADLGADARTAAPALARAMNDPDPNVRVNAARCLETLLPLLGREKRRFASDFITAANDTNYSVRADAMSFLAFYPNESSRAAPLLIKALDDPERTVRAGAMEALGAMDMKAAVRAGVVPALVKHLQNKDVTVRVFAIRRLGVMRQEPKLVVPALMELLGDDASVARFAAATALGRFGNEARPAVPALVKLLDAPEPPVRGAALEALKQIDPAAIPKTPAPSRVEAK